MRPRPCWPGGYARRSTPHFSVRQRSPLRNSFMPSRRHFLHLASVERAIAYPLDPPPLARAAAVVGLRGDVLDRDDLEARGLQRAHGRVAPGARALDEDLDLLQAVLHALARAGVGRHLSGERRRLARALEACASRRLPHDHVAFAIGDRDDRVVEGRLDVRLADGDVLAGLASGAATRRGATGSRGQCGFLDPFSSAAVAPEVLLLALLADGLLRPLAGARIRLRALTVNREPAAVAQPAVAADLHQTLDILGTFATQVAFDHQVLVDEPAELRDLVLGQVAHLRVAIDLERAQDRLRGGATDAEDVGEPDLDALLAGEVDACNSRHSSALPLLVAGIGADDHDASMASDDAALVTHGLYARPDLHDSLSRCNDEARPAASARAGMQRQSAKLHGSRTPRPDTRLQAAGVTSSSTG